jgi:hypothetical protein
MSTTTTTIIPIPSSTTSTSTTTHNESSKRQAITSQEEEQQQDEEQLFLTTILHDDDKLAFHLWDRITKTGRWFTAFNQPVEVIDGLFLGNGEHARNTDVLKTLKIGAIINTASSVVFTGSDFYKKKMEAEYLGFPSDDDETYPLLERHWKDVDTFYQQQRAMNKSVLVHCMAGMNRSAAMVVALMIQHHNIALFPAVEGIVAKRGIILSNDGFRKQLVQFAKERNLLT